MSIPWLKDVLVAEGVRVVEEGDWVNRAAAGGTFDPIGVLWHHTAFSSSAADPAPALATVIEGRPDLEGPLCHALVDYNGVFHLIAGGLANHAGPARASGPIPAGEGNAMLIGWEIDYAGDQPPEGVPDQRYTPAQYDASVKATAAVLRRLGRDASYARGHRETSLSGKIDPSYVDLEKMRADVAAALAGPDGPRGPVTDTGAGAVLVNGQYHVFGISPTGLLYENVWNGVWSGWRSLGGVVRGTPAVVTGNNRIDVFIIGTDAAMHQKTWSGTWGGWRNLGGKFADFSGAGAVLANGQYHVFGISPTGLLYENVWKNSWSGWRSLGSGLVRGTPAVTATGTRIDVFVLGRTGSMLQKTWTGTWGAYRDLGGKFADKSGAGAVLANGQYHVFGISPTNLLYENTWTGTWTGWRSLGGLVRGTPAATTTGNRIDVFTIGTNANMHQKTWNGTWGTYRNLGGKFG